MHAFTPITVVVARFDDLLARGLRQVIESDANLEIVADDVEHDRLGVVIRAHRPRVAILDVDALSSLAEVREFNDAYPDVRLVLLVSRATTEGYAQALGFGASALLGWNTQARDVLSAIHLAARGLQLIPFAARDLNPPSQIGPQLLTRREAEVLPMLQQGSSNMQIAVALQVGVETVRTHARNIYRKLGVSSRRELAALPLPAPSKSDANESALAPRRRAGSNRARRRRPGSVPR
jgi:DNA-binding NarL/FixJ family response regulator